MDTAVEVHVQLIDDVRSNGVAYFRLAIRLIFRFFTICHVPAQAQRAVRVGRELAFGLGGCAALFPCGRRPDG